MTDSYETEIKVSLVLLICFLLSLNFLSAYSLKRARQSQHDEHILNMELVKETIRNYVELNDMAIPELSFFQDLAHRALVDRIELIDNDGKMLMKIGAIEAEFEDKAITITAPIRNAQSEIVYYLTVSSFNREGKSLRRLVLFDSLIRVAGLVAGLIVAFFFIKTVLNPYRKMKKEAAELEIAQVDIENNDDMEFVVRTFHNIIRELKDKEALLQSMYNNSEKKADSLARYNEYILGGISSGVIICDKKGVITRFNPAAGEILNVDHLLSQGRHYSDIFGRGHHINKVFHDALKDKETVSRSEFEISIDNQEKRWIGLSSSLIRDNHDNNIGAAVLLTDLTKIKKLQEISDFTEKMAALGEMAAGLAHEFRNSVAAIMGFGKLIKKTIPVDNKAHQIAEMIVAESRTTEEMLQRFLTFAKPLKVVPEKVAIAQMVSDSLQALRESYQRDDIEIYFKDKTDGLIIDGDPTLLKNAFNNILLNAFQSIDYGGMVKINIDYEAKEKQAVIEIADTGKGISADELPKIFNPFFTTKDKGTGLGLALVKKIITGHYGNIEIKSRKGIGTTLMISIPVQTKRPPDWSTDKVHILKTKR